MKNVLKIVILGVIGFGFLVYATAEKPAQVKQVLEQSSLKLSDLPEKFEIVGKDDEVLKADLFEKGAKSLIVVGNHDSLAVVRELPKFYEMTIPYVMVANISSAPWFVKKCLFQVNLKS